jgi:hypothetical protein
VYKCTRDGKVTYSDSPCAGGVQHTLDVPSSTPPSDPQAELERLRRTSKELEQRRHAREDRQAREDAHADRLAARRREKCEQLRLAHKWAEEDARRSGPLTQEAARLKARRAAERHAAGCT